jgi:hypothetical protein
VIDTTADLAIEGIATASSRKYHRRAIPALTSEHSPDPLRADLVTAELSPETGDDTTRELPAEADLQSILTSGRQLAALDAHLVMLAGPSRADGYRDRARELIRALRATGGGRLRHIILVGHGPHNDAVDDAPGAVHHVAAAQLNLVVFVVSLRTGGHHV